MYYNQQFQCIPIRTESKSSRVLNILRCLCRIDLTIQPLDYPNVFRCRRNERVEHDGKTDNTPATGGAAAVARVIRPDDIGDLSGR